MSDLWVNVGDRAIRITHPDKEVLPGLTKADMIRYYVDVSEKILPWLKDRPLTLVRAPRGKDSFFFQKDMKYAPDWFKTWAYRGVRYAICNDLPSLVYLAEIDTVEIHIPAFHAPNPRIPDYVLFDLDPHPPAGWEDVVAVAFALRDLFRRYGLASLVKLSGKVGIHIILPSDGKITYETARELARRVGILLKSALPDVVTLRYNTPGVLIDYNQNVWNKTMVAPFSLRLNGNVSLPLDWSELEDPPNPTMDEALAREFPPPRLQDLSKILGVLGLK